jgi:hypothetical protein
MAFYEIIIMRAQRVARLPCGVHKEALIPIAKVIDPTITDHMRV